MRRAGVLAAAGLLVLATIASLASTASAQERKYYNSYMGQTPPELDQPAANWLGGKKPVTLGGMKGRIVYIEFSFLG
ncbi:MAG: hypothetical protein HY720_21775 [Planctomycetes bacterium]|nr:hypothetical protein [Planctomycetota bacterium]